jgi:prepilin-type N-terminal cleavage/methylation domain-containing protein
MKRKSGGFSLVELIVVIVIVAILATVLLDRAWVYQEQAEKAAMEEVAGVIQSALVMKYGHLMIRGAGPEIAALAVDNPINWLAKAPLNYTGEFYDPPPESVTPGNWFFDLKSRELIYVPERTNYFDPGAEGPKWVRYRVKLMYEAGSGATDKVLSSVLFEPIIKYHWFL